MAGDFAAVFSSGTLFIILAQQEKVNLLNNRMSNTETIFMMRQLVESNINPHEPIEPILRLQYLIVKPLWWEQHEK